MSVIDLGNIRFNWRGAYAAGANYVRDDVVGYKGSSYVALRNLTGVTPVVGPDWDLMASGTDQLLQEGDILIHDGASPIRLPRGLDAQILQLINGRPAWRTQAVDPSRRVAKLGKMNGHGGASIRNFLMADGTIKSVGWGGNYTNGDPAGMNIYLPNRLTVDDPTVKFIEIYSGGSANYALTASGEVWSWGYNNYGQLGHGDTVSRSVAKRIEFFVTNNIQIAKVVPNRPNYHDFGCALFLATDGKVYGCGYNGQGALGNGTVVNQPTPIRCGSLTNIVSVALSGLPNTAMAVQSNGDLWVWGYNAFGQLGLGDGTDRLTPMQHPSVHNAVKTINCSGYTTAGAGQAGFSVLLRSDGTIWTCGYNAYGQLGLGDTVDRSSFTQVNSPKFFTDIVAGDGRYPMVGAITNTGEFFAWGYNAYGQTGSGNTTNQLSPQKPAGLFQGLVSKAVIGGGVNYEGCILQAGNALWAAGYCTNGNIGIGAAAINSTFTKVYGISGNIVEWGSAGSSTTDWGLSVLYDDGRVDTCGANTYGETGTQAGNLHAVYTLKNVIF